MNKVVISRDGEQEAVSVSEQYGKGVFRDRQGKSTGPEVKPVGCQSGCSRGPWSTLPGGKWTSELILCATLERSQPGIFAVE